MKQNGNIVITGGGTGGHLSIARAMREALNRRGIQPIFIGSQTGQDKAWFAEDEGFSHKYFYDIQSVVDKGAIGKLKSMGKIFKAAWQTKALLEKHRVDTVFSVGGYAAAPATIAAIWQKKRFYIHEQNAVMGRLNALFAKRADALFSPYLEASPVKEYLVSEVYFQKARIRKEVKKVIFLGGSQGASAINTFARSVAMKLKERGIGIIHQTGEREFAQMQTFYEHEGIDADCFAFHKALHEKIAEADFAVSRAGAGTLWELVASQLPALFVPYPYAAGDHQYYNAKYLVDRGVAFVARQERLTPMLMEEILDSDIEKMSQALGGMITPDGADKIVTYLGY